MCHELCFHFVCQLVNLLIFPAVGKIREEIKRVIRQVTFISLKTGKINELRRVVRLRVPGCVGYAAN